MNLFDRTAIESRSMKHVFATLFGLFLTMHPTSANAADGDAPPDKTEKRAAQRLRIMRGAIGDFQVHSAQIDLETKLRFLGRPLLRYNDQSRETGGGIKGILDATIWRLGEVGRPTAIVALEIQLVENGAPLLINEFVSLTPRKFSLTHPGGFRWVPHNTDLMLAEFDDAPTPAGTDRARLAQMRELARRVTAQEKYRSEKISLRLLTQPIDRYDDPAANVLDGALFVFANGTNPELGLLLECSGTRWSYGFVRLTGARLLAQVDGKWALQSNGPGGLPLDAPYTAMSRAIFLPDDNDGE